MAAVLAHAAQPAVGLNAQTLAKFAADFEFKTIPRPICERAKHLMLDALGIAYASTQFEFAQRSLAALFENSSELAAILAGR